MNIISHINICTTIKHHSMGECGGDEFSCYIPPLNGNRELFLIVLNTYYFIYFAKDLTFLMLIAKTSATPQQIKMCTYNYATWVCCCAC